MDGWIKQSTAHTFQFGPFLDETDGKTAETGLTIAYTDVFLSKHGAAAAAKNDTTNLTGTGDTRGYYDCVLNATDTGTVGCLKVMCHVSGALPVWSTFVVLPANVYDSLVAATDNLQVDTTQWLGTACATPTTAGVPEVDVTFLDGDATSCDDLKDFADAGYDPVTNYITGIAGTKNTFDDLNDISTTDVNAQCDTALTDIGLDHLLSASVTGTDITDNSIIAKLVSKEATADWDDFVNTTDSLQAIRDVAPHGSAMVGTDGAFLAANAPANFSDLSITASTGLVDITQAAADKAWATATRALTDKADFALSSTSRAAVADDVWDEVIETDHEGDGSSGEHLNALAKAILARTNNKNLNALLGVDDAAGEDVPGQTAEETWAEATRALTDKAGFTISGTKQTLDALNDITAASVWSVGTRALTDKADFALSSASVDAIWDNTSSLDSVDFGTLVERVFMLLNNEMKVTDADGSAVLEPLGGGVDVATGNIADNDTTTTRSEWSWT